ncbi:transposase [Streptococcus danieliae]
MTRRTRRHFSDDFKQQIVDLHKAGKKRSEIIRQYDLTPSTFDKWVRQEKRTGSFKSIDNLSDEQRELMRLRKENRQLKMEVDILKQAAVIMAQKEL